MELISWVLYGVAILCVLAGIQARKDFIRFVGCFGLAMIFGLFGMVTANIADDPISDRVERARVEARAPVDAGQ